MYIVWFQFSSTSTTRTAALASTQTKGLKGGGMTNMMLFFVYVAQASQVFG